METLFVTKVAGGTLHRVAHLSSSTKTKMTLSVFVPAGATETAPAPVLFFLSGLTCTDENFTQKSGAFKAAGAAGLAVVVPDTSPRGANVAGEAESWDFGVGAGFYLDATAAPWAEYWRMKSYVAGELPVFVATHFKALNLSHRSIAGHSMGGHGALTLAFREPGAWTSVSAFAPVCQPSESAWGKNAFGRYLHDRAEWAQYDATALMQSSGPFASLGEILIDQGADDKFLAQGQLRPEALAAACKAKGQRLRLRTHAGFDHSYYFINAFIDDHIQFHARALRAKAAAAAAAAIVAPSSPAAATSASSTAGQPIRCRAAVAWAANEPLSTEWVEVEPPRRGEVRVRVVANALCHTDVYTWSGQDPEANFPSILGHEAGCVVESVGEGVTSVAPGDHVVPCYTPQCCEPSCIFCQSPKTNLCPKIRGMQGKGLMPDGTARFSVAKRDGSGGRQPVFHFMGCSTMSEYTVIAEISAAKITPQAPLEKVCLFGCGVSTGFGAVWNTCRVEPGSSVAVFGCGAVGLAVIQAARAAGATRIFAIDTNSAKFDATMSLGATDFLNPTELAENVSVQSVIVQQTGWGVDYSFDCTGSVKVMRSALECAHRGWGVSCVIGVAPAGFEIATRPFQLVTGRVWKGTAFGGWKSRTQVPQLVKRYLAGELPIDHFITHTLKGVDRTNDAIAILKSGECLRCVVHY